MVEADTAAAAAQDKTGLEAVHLPCAGTGVRTRVERLPRPDRDRGRRHLSDDTVPRAAVVDRLRPPDIGPRPGLARLRLGGIAMTVIGRMRLAAHLDDLAIRIPHPRGRKGGRGHRRLNVIVGTGGEGRERVGGYMSPFR